MPILAHGTAVLPNTPETDNTEEDLVVNEKKTQSQAVPSAGKAGRGWMETVVTPFAAAQGFTGQL